MRKYKIIVNPESGRGEGGRAIPQIEDLLNSHTLDFEIVRTEKPWHAVELAQQAATEGFDVVVAAGGDGTANEVLNGLMRAKNAGVNAAMAVLPIGQGNDFAFGMEIPSDLETACLALAKDRRRMIDVGRVTGGRLLEGRFFGNGIGIGFDAVVGFEALKLKRLHGFPAYLVAALKTIFLFFKAPKVRIDLDDESLTLPALMVSIMNGRRMGGGFMMAPHGDPGDGILDLCIASEVSKLKIFALILRFMKGDQGTHPAVQFKRSKRAKVTALEGVLPTHADGETVSTEKTELSIELLASQIEVVY
ncbi:MAG: diacylglycerol kinase family lipid kinase [Anaerolineales bacterium]|nr:diacylglycerol kinase family lipid kinase [Chloroflexota bacterium]MBL6983691.1 diacylglycerol kinase family lipid kinase [Anaerolineales bacterium]